MILRIQLLEFFAAWAKVESLPFCKRGIISRGFVCASAKTKKEAMENLLDTLSSAMTFLSCNHEMALDPLIRFVRDGQLVELARHLHKYHWILLDFGVCPASELERKLARGILRPTPAEITTIDAPSASG